MHFNSSRTTMLCRSWISVGLIILGVGSALADFAVQLDAGRLRVNAATALPHSDNAAPSKGGSLLLVIAANGDGQFSSDLSPGQFVGGNDLVLAAGGFNTNAGTDETQNFFPVSSVGNTLIPGDRVALRWFPDITYQQYLNGVTPVGGQAFGTYNPRTSNPNNTSDNPDGGSPWLVPQSGTITLTFYTTDSSGGGTQTPAEGYAPTLVATPTPSPSPSATVSPSPSATVSPSPSATVSPSPSATVSPSPSATISPSPSATVSPSPSASASPSPSVSPSPSATISPSPSATVSPSPSATASPTPTPALGNISTRLSVGTGDNVLIAGFIVEGPTGSTKKVLIRGLGPTLSRFGVPSVLPDPFLTLHKADKSTSTNDNWRIGPYTSQIPPGFEPGDDRESVIVETLSPGLYSAILEGANGESGVGLAEVYDIDSSSPAHLANLSTRGVAGTKDDAIIGGVVVSGSSALKLVIRAIGPSLTQFGVTGALADPSLELHDRDGAVITTNDNWPDSPQAAEIQSEGLAPNDTRESAISVSLTPGNYTAIVRGVNGGTGVGLVECYRIVP